MTRLLALFLLAFAVLPAAGQLRVENENMIVSFEAGPQSGDRRTAAIVMTPPEGWHTYWQNPGAAGVAATTAWALPDGAAASDIRYPVPDRFVVSGIMNYVFKEARAFLVDLTGLPDGIQPFSLRIDYLVCDDSICVPEFAELSGTLTDAEVGAQRIARWEAHQPQPYDGAEYQIADDQFRLRVDLPDGMAIRDAYFFPAVDGALDYNAVQTVSLVERTLTIETTGSYGSGFDSVPGVLKLVRPDGSAIGLDLNAASGTVDAAPISAKLDPAATDTQAANRLPGLPALFLLALAGGLLLNVMPCVFPILSLKALHLARGGMSEQAAKTDALAYSAGVVVTVLALGGLLLALRAGGESVGWAFQLQNPLIVSALLLLVMAIALNLAGLYELPGISITTTGAERGGAMSSFSTGLLAAVIATPCTGPFMGLALGAALFVTVPAALTIFFGLGLGLALPFLLLGFVPALRQRLPKPGAWMATLRKLLSLPMFATALGLAWVLSRQVSSEAFVSVLGVAMLVALGLWWLGSAKRKAMPLVATVLAAALVLFVPYASSNPARAEANGVLAASAFSPEALAAAQASGQPTFLYFTADWCITCKVNENGALSSAAVADHFEAAGIQTLVGDWTSADPTITEFLTAEGRAGVPLYLYYSGDGEKEVLPQILTVDRLLELGA